jgi:tetratricopeptide (TPR) repeat protein
MRPEHIREKRNSHIEAGEYTEALKYCMELIDDGTTNLSFDDWFNKGFCHFKLDQNAEAVESYTKALEIDPLNFQLMTNKAISLLHIDKTTEAFQLFRKALHINPNIGPAWLNIGLHHIYNTESKDAHKKAINAFRRSVMIVPRFGEIEVFSKRTIDDLLYSSESVEDLDNDTILVPSDGPSIRQRKPQDPESWSSTNTDAVALHGRALSLLTQGLEDEALNLFNQALSINPTYITAWYNKGRLLRTLDRFEESVTCCLKVIDIDSEYPNVWTMLGNNFLSMERCEGSVSAYNKALDIDSADVLALHNKAVAEERLGRS